MALQHAITLESCLPDRFPTSMYPNCLALLSAPPFDQPPRHSCCPVCAVTSMPTETTVRCERGTLLSLAAQGVPCDFATSLSHGRTLAILAACARGFLAAPHAAAPRYAYPPVRVILEALRSAQYFVHFITNSLSLPMLGALKMTALRTAVRGILCGGDAGVADECQRVDEAPYLQIRTPPRPAVAPQHRPLLVVDGLLAFTGAVDLTVNTLRQAAGAPACFTVVTDVHEVVQLHNGLISPLWPQGNNLTPTPSPLGLS